MPCWGTVLSVAQTVVFSVPVDAPVAAFTVRVTEALAPGARLLIVVELSTEGSTKLAVLPVSEATATVKFEGLHEAESLFVTLAVYDAVPPFVVIVFVEGVTVTACALRVQGVTFTVVATGLDVTVPC